MAKDDDVFGKAYNNNTVYFCFAYVRVHVHVGVWGLCVLV